MGTYWEKANHSWTDDSLRIINTPSKKSQKMFYYVQEAGHFKAFKPYYTERENLSSYLVKFTLAGQGILNYQNKEYLLNPGDIFFIDCMNYQYYATNSVEPWEMDWVHLQGNNVAEFYTEFMKNGSSRFTSENMRFHKIITNILTLQKNKNARTEYTTSLLIHELLNELVIQKNQLDFEEQDIPIPIQNLQHYLDLHFQENINLEILEKKFMINRYQLSKDFSKYIGSPPIDYLIANRINLSKDLLRYTTKSIKEVSIEIGIENIPYFCRLFKNRTGMTPNTFRKNG